MSKIKVVCRSFGFKYGTDELCDTLFDARCLPNPFYEEELKHKTGLEKSVRDYVMRDGRGKEFLDCVIKLLQFTLPIYEEKGRSVFTVSFGCTGGQHRSVTIAYLTAEHLRKNGYEVELVHRDIDKSQVK